MPTTGTGTSLPFSQIVRISDTWEGRDENESESGTSIMYTVMTGFCCEECVVKSSGCLRNARATTAVSTAADLLPRPQTLVPLPPPPPLFFHNDLRSFLWKKEHLHFKTEVEHLWVIFEHCQSTASDRWANRGLPPSMLTKRNPGPYIDWDFSHRFRPRLSNRCLRSKFLWLINAMKCQNLCWASKFHPSREEISPFLGQLCSELMNIVTNLAVCSQVIHSIKSWHS